MEFLSPSGLRNDGRRPNEIRTIKWQANIFPNADGSAAFSSGNTQVICSVFGPREVVSAKTDAAKAIINVEYSMATFSSTERKNLSNFLGGEVASIGSKKFKDRRATEISRVIRNTFESIILTHLFPRTRIDIYFTVLQADGGTRCACINAASLALMDAGIPMVDFVTSCAAGVVFLKNKLFLQPGAVQKEEIIETDKQTFVPIVDLSYVEDASGNCDVPVAYLNNKKKMILLQMDGGKLDINVFEHVVKTGIEGCSKIFSKLNGELKSS